MMKVLQIGLGSNPGGIENCILNYCKNADLIEVRFDFADIYGNGLAFSKEFENLGGRIHNIGNYKKHPIKTIYKLHKIIMSEKYDVVHYNTLSLVNIIPIMATVGCKSKLIVHSHSSALPRGVAHFLLNSINKKIVSKMKISKWACSHKAGTWMWGKEFDDENIIYNAIDTEKYYSSEILKKEKRDTLGLSSDNIVLGFVGHFVEEKNVLFMLSVVKQLMDMNPKYRLLTVGDGDMMSEFRMKSEEYQISDKIINVGKQSDVCDWYRAMDALLLPSIFEGLPLVAIEAQAMKVKCFVSSNITDEINITGCVDFISIYQGEKIWAREINNYFSFDHSDSIYNFPDNYKANCAAAHLLDKYKGILSHDEN